MRRSQESCAIPLGKRFMIKSKLVLALALSVGLVGSAAAALTDMTVNGEKVTDFKAAYTPEDIMKEDFVVRRGKKKYSKIVFE